MNMRIAARWDQAEAAHRQALALVQAEGNAALICNAHDKLSVFYAMLGNVDRALAESQAAVAAARTTGMAILLSMALRGLCRCHLIKGDIAPAAAAAEEAVRVVPAEKMNDTARAFALLMRARCRVEQREVVQAGQDLTIAWPILAPRAKATMFGGIQNALAGWWEITARIRTQAREFGGAAEALGKAVEFRRTVSNLPPFAGAQKYHALAEVLEKYAVALTAAGEAAAAAGAFDESRKIQQRTGIVILASATV